MKSSIYRFRVRYAETDKMGYVYYGNYAAYLEVARVEWLRDIGVSYKDLEDQGILLPVSHFSIKYRKPLLYDEEFSVHTHVKEIPSGVKIHFTYEIYNSQEELTTTAEVTLFFFDAIQQKTIPCPSVIREAMEKSM